MKRFKYIIFFLAFFEFCRAQDDSLVLYRVQINSLDFSIVKNDDIIQTSIPELNTLLRNGKIIDLHQSFPYSKKRELLNLYTIICNREDTLIVSGFFKLMNFPIKNFSKRSPVFLYEPSDSHYQGGYQWYLQRIEANNAWDITKGSSDVTIAIIDSKFDRYHPDLADQFIVGYDPYTFVNHINYEDCECDYDHGTEVASVAISQTDGGGKNASVGFNTKFYAYTMGFLDESIEKAQHASLILGVDVISISWGQSDSYDSVHAAAINEIIDNGTIIVAAAGNGPENNNGLDMCPFCALNDVRVIVVSSTGHNDQHTSFNALGVDNTDSHYPRVDLCAPGRDIMVATPSLNSTWPYYGSGSGTSLAAPQVAATCALMRSVNKCLTPEEVEEILKSTCDPITDENLYPGLVGAGRLNTFQAVLSALEAGTIHIDGLNLTGSQTYSSGLYLSSSNSTVKNGAHITFQAGRDITLNAGFSVELGGEFTTASIPVSCN
jgi:subtilisin family serine protease